MFDNYRRVLAVPGAARFSATGLVARLPISMMGLGIVLLVSEVTGSYAIAGSVSAAYLIGNAIAAVPLGRVVDHFGQSRVLAATAVSYAAATTLLMVSVWWEWTLWTSYAASVAAGLVFPPVGACVRARWSTVLPDPRRLQTAFALEAVVDEAVFILGPILVTFLATGVHPLAGLGVGVVAGLLGTLALAAQRSTQPPPGRHADGAAVRAPMPWRRILTLAVVCLMLGAFFGSAEVATVAFAEESGARSAAGWLLALWAFGSLAAGLITGAIAWKQGPDARLRIGTIAMTVVLAPMAFIGSTPVMGVALFLAGFAIAPTLIAATALAERSAPPGRLTETMAIINTGIVAGVAPGATVAGVAIDHSGSAAAYAVAVGAGTLAAVVAQTLPRRG